MGSGEDVVRALETVSETHRIVTGTLVARGTLTVAAVGVYDPSQRVYVTRMERRALELIVAHGTIGRRNQHPFVHLHGLMTDGANHCTGGRLFPGTIAYSIDFIVQELTGPPVEWRYDPATGMQGIVFDHQ